MGFVTCTEIYGHGRNVQKSSFYSVMPPYPHAFDTHTVINKALHGRKRRVLSQAFSDTAIRGMEDNVLTHVRRFTENLGKESYTTPTDTEAKDMGNGKGGVLQGRNMALWSNWLTFDVIGDLCFGKGFGMLEKEEWRFWPGLVDQAIHRHAIVSNYTSFCFNALFPSSNPEKRLRSLPLPLPAR